jgi:hypothetical protein
MGCFQNKHCWVDGVTQIPIQLKAAKQLLQQVLTASSDELGYGRSGLPNRLNFNLQQHEQQHVCQHAGAATSP